MSHLKQFRLAICAAACLLGVGVSPLVHAYPITQWEASAGGNGHYYQAVDGLYTWQQAYDLAAASSFDGQQGYLVTMTSMPEVQFVQSLLSQTGTLDGFFIGGSDSASEGNWQWVDGPDAGTPFFFAPHQYPWVYIQPDNYQGNQNWAIGFIGGPGRSGEHIDMGVFYLDDTWSYSLGGYVVEFGGSSSTPPVPEPETYAMLLGGLGLLGLMTRRRKQMSV